MYIRAHSGVGIEEKSIFKTYIAMLIKSCNLGLKFSKKEFYNQISSIENVFHGKCFEPKLSIGVTRKNPQKIFKDSSRG